MANNDKRGRKKTRREVSAYKDYVKYDTHDQYDTVFMDNVNLRGSDQIESDSVLQAKEPIIPLHHKLKRFFQKYAFETIIVTLFTTFLIWGASTIIQIKVDVAVSQTKIDFIQAKIEGLEVNEATKDFFELQLDALASELENSFNLEIAKINAQIDLLEQQIEYLEKNSTGKAE